MPTGAGSNLAWTNQSSLTLLGIAAIIALGLPMFFVNRKHLVLPLLIACCFVAPGQRIVIATLDFNVLRILLLCGMLRIFARGEFADWRVDVLDKLVLAWSIVSIVAYTILFGSLDAFIYKMGATYDVAMIYVVFRVWARDLDAIEQLGRWLAVLAIPVSVFFYIESTTGRNLFSVFGGVPEYTMIREGRLRCQGAFSHPILAGCFFAAVVPLIIAAIGRPGSKKWLLVPGLLCSVAIVVMCASSTPLGGVVVAVGGYFLLPLRGSLRPLRWGIAAMLVLLHLVMEAPVWHLISRLDLAGGSTGYHRFMLIDAAIRNFDEWFLVGTQATRHWGWGMQDVTNHFILEGVRGGVLAMALFTAIIVSAFFAAGRLVKLADYGGERGDRIVAWSVGVSMLVHLACFVAVSYFHQNMVIMLGTVGLLASTRQNPFAVPAAVDADEEEDEEPYEEYASYESSMAFEPVPAGPSFEDQDRWQLPDWDEDAPATSRSLHARDGETSLHDDEPRSWN